MSRNPKRAPDKSLGNNSEKLSIKRNPVEAGSCAVAAESPRKAFLGQGPERGNGALAEAQNGETGWLARPKTGKRGIIYRSGAPHASTRGGVIAL